MTSIPFVSEAQLARVGRRAIRSVLERTDQPIRTRNEVRGPGSIPDLVVFAREAEAVRYVVTVEFKLRNWNRALQQAFRHRNFANEAYVLIDDAHVEPARKNLSAFQRANIGLVSVGRAEALQFWHFPNPDVPFSPEFSRSLMRSLLRIRSSQLPDLEFTRTTKGGLSLAKLRDFALAQ